MLRTEDVRAKRESRSVGQSDRAAGAWRIAQQQQQQCTTEQQSSPRKNKTYLPILYRIQSTTGVENHLPTASAATFRRLHLSISHPYGGDHLEREEKARHGYRSSRTNWGVSTETYNPDARRQGVQQPATPRPCQLPTLVLSSFSRSPAHRTVNNVSSNLKPSQIKVFQ